MRKLVRAQRERVHLGPADLPTVGDHLGADPLRDEVVALEQFGRKRPAPLLLRVLVGGKADSTHVLDAAGDDELIDAGRDPQRAEVHGLLPRATADVDGGRAGRLGKTLLQPSATV